MKKSTLVLKIGMVILITLNTFTSKNLFAQGGIKGQVKSSLDGSTIPGVTVVYKLNGNTKAIRTDENGFYSIHPLEEGKYDLTFYFMGYDSLIKKNVIVESERTTFVDPIMHFSNELRGVIIDEYAIPLIRRDMPTMITMGQGDIDNAVVKDVKYLASNIAGISQADANKPLHFRGGREGNVKYILDGMPLPDNNLHIPGCSIAEISVIPGGIPARYGDTTGGVVIVTSKNFKGW